ncbi:orotate phosphoribosyltransferase [Rapidithrix thailandica]|uniref:Orotate phosphoribosyltransferase n=1 Tax=Rapidithrix thailandica TaxID=413964 RepID=A0AAW9S111_9BACT
MENVSKPIASKLLEIGAIKIQPDQPFTWASGWKSPIYCDNRLSLSHPEVRSYVKEKLSDLIKSTYPEAAGIAGVATAGIPQGALVADQLDLPFVYVRSKPKGHGMENLIEGKLPEGSKVVVIEDLISTGGSSIKAAQALQKAGYEVLGLLAIFTYGFDVASENFVKAGIEFHTLSDYPTLLDVAVEQNRIRKDTLQSLNNWQTNPADWGK